MVSGCGQGMSLIVVLQGKGILQGNGLIVHVLDGKRGCAGTRRDFNWHVYGRGRGLDYGSCKMLRWICMGTLIE